MLEIDTLRQIAALLPQRVADAPAQGERDGGDYSWDTTRSGFAWHLALSMAENGDDYDGFCVGLSTFCPDWYAENGKDSHQCRRTWENAVAKRARDAQATHKAGEAMRRARRNNATRLRPLLECLPLTDADTIDKARLKQPDWVFQTWAPKRKVTLLAGTAGIGKSAIVTAMSLSVATGQELLGLKVYGGNNGYAVAHILLEDDQDDLVNSYAAALLHHKISPRVLDQVHILGNRPGHSVSDIVIAKRDQDGNVTAMPIVNEMIDWLVAGQKDVLIVDPFRFTHKLSENSNDDMGEVMQLWNRVALEANCAVVLIHHFAKGPGTGVDKASGAHAIPAHSRSAVPLSTPLTEEQVAQYGIADHRNNYIRVDTLKVNFQPQPEKAIWFRLVPVPMRGDFSVVAAERWYPPALQSKRVPALPDELFAIVNKGLGNGEYYTRHHIKNGNDDSRWFGHQVMDVMGVDEKKAKEYIKGWLENGFLREEHYPSPRASRPRWRVTAPTDQGREG